MARTKETRANAAPGAGTMFALRAIGLVLLARWLFSMGQMDLGASLSAMASSPWACVNLVFLFLLIFLPGAFLKPEAVLWQYTHGVPDTTRVSPDGYSLDNFYLARPGADEVQLDLFGDYKSNVALYPTFQIYFRTHKPPFLAVWGKHDPFFLPPGAEAFKRDMPDAVVRFFDTGHFALETHAVEIAAAIREFFDR